VLNVAAGCHPAVAPEQTSAPRGTPPRSTQALRGASSPDGAEREWIRTQTGVGRTAFRSVTLASTDWSSGPPCHRRSVPAPYRQACWRAPPTVSALANEHGRERQRSRGEAEGNSRNPRCRSPWFAGVLLVREVEKLPATRRDRRVIDGAMRDPRQAQWPKTTSVVHRGHSLHLVRPIFSSS
jgi:hypothetical protein